LERNRFYFLETVFKSVRRDFSRQKCFHFFSPK
jgi:hypothetical protein